jgi:hypothetical protein
MRRSACIRITLTSTLAAAALTACQDSPAEPEPSFAQAAGAIVNGGGSATVTDPGGAQYDARVSIAASMNASGVAQGVVNVVFGQAFSAAWGATPGVHTIHLNGRVEAITAGAGGAITLTGTAVEVDVVTGGNNLVFPNEPFQIVFTGPDTFSLTWCLLPTFDFHLNTGALSFGRALAVLTLPRLNADLNSGGCPRAG